MTASSRGGPALHHILLALLALAAALVLTASFVGSSALGQSKDNLRVVFFDIGQGDSIFIESPSGMQMLVDGGPGTSVLRELSKEMGFFDRTIDVVLATHPDKDHIGGLPDVLERYDVGSVIMTEVMDDATTKTAQAFVQRVSEEGADVVYARRGMHINLGDGADLEILFPDRDPKGLESNTSSIVARLTYGESEFLLTGDSPQAIEKYLVSLDGAHLRSDVLKAGHHGSRTSSSEIFVQTVSPDIAVISAGKGNQYGHPHKEVVDLLKKYGIQIENTAEGGDIVFESDGKTLSLK